MKYSLCIETCFNDIDLYDRIRIAKDLGFDAVEFYNPADMDLKKLKAALEESGMPVAIMGYYNGFSDRLTGDFDLIFENLKKGVAFGKEVGCLTFTSHVCAAGPEPECTRKKLVENLKKMAPYLERENVTLAIEVLNSKYEAPDYLLDTTEKAFSVINEVGCGRVKILNDLFHTQIMEGDIINTVKTGWNKTAHYHAASVPKRDELFHGELNYREVARALDEVGYEGYMGMEYWPSYDNMQSYRDVLAYMKTNA